MLIRLFAACAVALAMSACIADPQASADPSDELDSVVVDARIRDRAVDDLAVEPVDATPPPDAGPIDAALPLDAVPPPDAALPVEPPDWLPDPPHEIDVVVPVGTVICVDARDYAPPGAFDDDEWRFEWVFVAIPNGAVAGVVERFFDDQQPGNGGVPDDETTPTACTFVAPAGYWQLNLRVTHVRSGTMVLFAKIHALAVEDGDLFVELQWHTPDAERNDRFGADLDLLLRHERASEWESGPWICAGDNIGPDWGPPGRDGDPRHGGDETTGASPEIVWLSSAETAEYLIGVRFVSHRPDIDPTDTEATVRIFLRGELAFEDRRFVDPRAPFWPVARLEWGQNPVLEALE